MASTSLSPTFGDMDGGHDQRSSLIAALRARLGESDSADIDGDVTGEAADFEADGLALVPPKQEEAMEDVSLEYLSDFLFAHAQDAGSNEAPEGEAPTGTVIENKFMQMDKRSDARSKVMDALKVQMSRSAAIPKQAPPVPPASAGGSQVIDVDLDSADEMPAPAAVTFHEPPRVCPCGNVPKRTAKFCIQCGRPWEAPAMAAPPPKRLRQNSAGHAPTLASPPALVPVPEFATLPPSLTSAPLLSSPTPTPVLTLAPVPELMPVAVLAPAPPLPLAPALTLPVSAAVPKPAPPLLPVPLLQPQLVPLSASVPQLQPAPPAVPVEPSAPESRLAEAAELAARKAAMLGRLQAAETVGRPAAVASNMPGGPPPQSAPVNTGPSNQGSDGPSPDASGCPPGSTPEQYEAYRRKCWEQYYEYTSVWKKYYNQNQAEQTGKGKTKDKGKGKMKGMQPGSIPADLAQNPAMALSLPGKSMASGKGFGAPAAHVVLPPGYTGKGTPLLGMGQPGRPPTVLSGNLAVAAANQLVNTKVPQAMPPEEDIHSKLLGL